MKCLRGGSGDHAAIKLGKPGAILHIGSLPVSVEAVPFPRGYKIVAVVDEQHAQELVDDMESRYYRPRGLPVRGEIVAPVGGAGGLDM